MLSLEEVVNDPHLHERGTLHWHDHPVLGRVVLANSPVRFSHADLPVVQAVPEAGAHNANVYGELLGIDAGEVASLRAREAI